MWKYCGNISRLGFFILYIISPFSHFISSIHIISFFSFFFFLVFFLHTHCPISIPPPPLLFSFSPSHSRTLQQLSFSLFFLQLSLSLSLFFFEKQRREWEKKRKEATEMKEKKKAMERMREKKKSGGERNNWYNSSWYNFLIKKIQLLMYNSPSDLMSYCSWAKKIQDLENLLETIFWVSFSIIEIILLLATSLEMLLEH